MEFTAEEKHALVKLLLMTAKSDGDFDHREKRFILHVLKLLGLTSDDLKDPQDIDNVYPESEQMRMTILYYLLFLIRSDRTINHAETDFVKKMGLQLGFNTKMVDKMVDVMKKYLDEDLPKEALLDSIKPYLN